LRRRGAWLHDNIGFQQDEVREGNMDIKKAGWIAICGGIGAIVGVAIGDALSVSHAIGMVLAGLGGALGAAIGGYVIGR